MKTLKIFASLASLLLFVTCASADDLTPPGPPGSAAASMKSLNQIEPRILIESLPTVITNPGSYYVTANLVNTQNTAGITISASDVHIDLNGFALISTASTQGAGIYVPNARRNLKFENGILKNWPYEGIWASATTDSSVSRVNAVSNGWDGIWLGAGAVVENCMAIGNALAGIHVGANSTVQDCTSRNNNQDGIEAGAFCRINDCTAMVNGACGITAGGGSRIKGCTSGGNNYGVMSEDASLIQDCVVSGNNTNGIEVAKAVRVIACNARGNEGNGIVANDGSIIRDCISSANGGDGILITSNCLVEKNNATSNGQRRTAAGIHSTSDGNKIDNNNVANNNDKGIYISAGKSIVMRNTAHNNDDGGEGNYSLGTGSVRGGIVQDQITIPIGRPWANFSF